MLSNQDNQSNLNQVIAQLQQAIARNPKNATAHTQLGNILRQQGNQSAAIQSFQTALQLNPNNASIHSTLGILFAEQEKWDTAVHHLQQAIALSPKTISLHVNLGYVLRSQGKLDEAFQSFQTALTLNPKHPPVHNGLGLVLMDQGDLKTAATHFQKVIGLNPKDADAHLNLGLVQKRQGEIEEAIANFQHTIHLNPNLAMAWTNLGLALQEQDKLEEAIRNLRKALNLNPNDADVHTCLGMAYHEQGNLEKTEYHLRKAIALNSKNAQAYSNLAHALETQGKLDAAIESYQKAIQRNPDFAEAHLYLAQCLLKTGNLHQGFTEFEWRWQMIESLSFPQPRWDGSSLDGKTLLIWIEAGFGDIIQFIRYVPFVRNVYGGRVIVTCRPALQRLLETVAGIDQLVLEGNPLPEFDVHVPLMSVPHVVGTTLETIPVQIPYLSPPAEQNWKLELLPQTNLRIGVVWASGYKTVGNLITKIDNRILSKNKELRSCPLSSFARLLTLPNVTFYSLQVGQNAKDIAALDREHPLQDLTPHIQDFADTAAFIDQMDLVISVDTAVVHLAGALGKPIWVLLPFAADWRWLQEREDSPWYPTMRLFRQRSPGDWDGILTQVTEALVTQICDFSKKSQI